ncbi:MAG: deoxyhypusine synthase family protein [Pseudomonadota bacterium]|nr:deoxyhypusine synthase family protein [Pseudomonadota bacterium]
MTAGKHHFIDLASIFQDSRHYVHKIMDHMDQAIRTCTTARILSRHHHLFDGTQSPPGFTCMFMLDESHASAHYYQETGLLAIDFFTCGSSDNSRAINFLIDKLKKDNPELKLTQSKQVDRFKTDVSSRDAYTKPVKGFINKYYQNFNARTLKDCVESLIRFMKQGGRCVVSLGGGLSTAQIGIGLAPLIEKGLISAISTTGANLEEDVFSLIGRDDYKEVLDWREQGQSLDVNLYNTGYSRITDVAIHENNLLDTSILKLLGDLYNQSSQQQKSHFPHEYLYDVIHHYEPSLKHHPRMNASWVKACRDHQVPIFTPGWEDSTLGNHFAALVHQGKVDKQCVKCGVDTMNDLINWYQAQTNPVGLLQLGGGVSGDFVICVAPLVARDLVEGHKTWDFFAQVSDSTTSYGSYSGAHPSEKITWGKIKAETPSFMIESDATIVAPLIFESLLEAFS